MADGEVTETFTPYKCSMCDNKGDKQVCKEHNTRHGHHMVHLKKEFKNGTYAWWLCDDCAEREQ